MPLFLIVFFYQKPFATRNFYPTYFFNLEIID